MWLLLTLALVLATAMPAPAESAQYEMEFAELTVLQRTDLATGTTQVEIVPIANPQPGGPSWEIRDPVTHATIAFVWSESDGARIEWTPGGGGLLGEFHWFGAATPTGFDPEASFYIDASGTGHTFVRFLASGVRSPVRVFITQPRNGATVSGTVWVVLWADGTSGTSNTFTLSADGRQVSSQTSSSRGPVTLPWSTTPTGALPVPNGAHTLTGTVRDATGRAATTSITVIVHN